MLMISIDYKCTTTIFDIETQDEDEYGRIGTVVNIFYSHPERMPKISGPGDALLIRKIKVSTPKLWDIMD